MVPNDCVVQVGAAAVAVEGPLTVEEAPAVYTAEELEQLRDRSQKELSDAAKGAHPDLKLPVLTPGGIPKLIHQTWSSDSVR